VPDVSLPAHGQPTANLTEVAVVPIPQ